MKFITDQIKEKTKTLVWHKQRIGKITASRFKEIFTHTDVLQSSESEIVEVLRCKIIQCIPQTQIWQIKYGIVSEYHATVIYKKNYMTREHTNYTASDCGMHIFETIPSMCASTDLIFSIFQYLF